MRRTMINAFLVIAMLLLLGLNHGLSEEKGKRNFEVFPDMASSPASESYSANALFADGMTMRAPVEGTVVRGLLPLRFAAGEAEAIRAGIELTNPLSPDAAELERGAAVYATYCQVCHGTTGAGDGPVSKRGFPTPPALSAENALGLPDGRIFHIITFGQNQMPPYAAQIDRDDRWRAVMHLRQLQAKSTTSVAGSETHEAIVEDRRKETPGE